MMRHAASRRRMRSRAPQRAFVLVVVLIAIAMLSLAGFTFTELMFAERQAAHIHGRAAQTRAGCQSGLELMRLYLEQEPAALDEMGGLYDNPDRLQGVLLLDGGTARDRASFTILAPRIDQGYVGGVRYGLENESARLNVNVLASLDSQQTGAGRRMLMALPGMTEDVADALLDWLDDDDLPRELGAEDDYYTTLDPPYLPTNGPIESIDELLLVRGVTPWLLYGPDVNRNHQLDSHEQSAASSGEVDNSDGAMNHGWAAYLTIHSRERGLQPDGTEKIDLNASDLEQLHEDLSAVFDESWARFIITYRQAAPFQGEQPGQPIGAVPLDLERQAQTNIARVLDLVGAKLQLQTPGQEQPTIVAPVFADDRATMSEYLAKLLDHVTVDASPITPGRININQAPRHVLLGLPGMTELVADRIIADRTPIVTEERPEHRHPTWLVEEGVVTLDVMQELMPWVTCGGDVHRAQIVGFFDRSGPASRWEAVVDATTRPVRVLSWRNLGHLGRGYSLESLGAENRE